mmetsp:Transcript_27228/g.91520  ORF Transcript_27228/g.91520 Transcript_27228/m.91520 type:complete len:469 (-) Transcript_27228:454-1860(-)
MGLFKLRRRAARRRRGQGARRGPGRRLALVPRSAPSAAAISAGRGLFSRRLGPRRRRRGGVPRRGGGGERAARRGRARASDALDRGKRPFGCGTGHPPSAGAFGRSRCSTGRRRFGGAAGAIMLPPRDGGAQERRVLGFGGGLLAAGLRSATRKERRRRLVPRLRRAAFPRRGRMRRGLPRRRRRAQVRPRGCSKARGVHSCDQGGVQRNRRRRDRQALRRRRRPSLRFGRRRRRLCDCGADLALAAERTLRRRRAPSRSTRKRFTPPLRIRRPRRGGAVDGARRRRHRWRRFRGAAVVAPREIGDSSRGQQRVRHLFRSRAVAPRPRRPRRRRAQGVPLLVSALGSALSEAGVAAFFIRRPNANVAPSRCRARRRRGARGARLRAGAELPGRRRSAARPLRGSRCGRLCRRRRRRRRRRRPGLAPRHFGGDALTEPPRPRPARRLAGARQAGSGRGLLVWRFRLRPA